MLTSIFMKPEWGTDKERNRYAEPQSIEFKRYAAPFRSAVLRAVFGGGMKRWKKSLKTNERGGVCWCGGWGGGGVLGSVNADEMDLKWQHT